MALDRKTGDFGSRLREAREQKGVSLREIANATKISIRALEALERNDISRLPGGIFSRAFVRAYAVEAGLDPEGTVEDFVRQFPHETVTAGHPPSAQIDDTVESERRMASVVVRLLAISVPIAGVLVYYGLAGRRGASVDPAPPAAVVKADAAAVATPEARAGHLTIEIVATRPMTISASVDTTPLVVDSPLEAGGRRTFSVEQELVLKVSDGSAMTWSINGSAARPLGTTAQPATVLLTVDNYKDYLTAR